MKLNCKNLSKNRFSVINELLMTDAALNGIVVKRKFAKDLLENKGKTDGIDSQLIYKSTSKHRPFITDIDADISNDIEDIADADISNDIEDTDDVDISNDIEDTDDVDIINDVIASGLPLYDKNNNVFYEPFYKMQRVIILGAGHIAVPLSMMAKMIGFYVVVVDDRAEFADKSRFPQADEVICRDFAMAIDSLHISNQDFVVIVTRGHAHDSECIEALMNYDEPLYTGLIGSKRRVAMVFEALRAEGYDSHRLDRIHTPIGLDIGAKTIEEIDISIMAEIVKVRRKDSVGNALVDRADHDMKTIAELGRIQHPCAIVTILSDEGSTPRSAGAVMAVFVDGTIIGSIGGGCVEGAVVHLAKSIIGTKSYEIKSFSLDGNAAMDEGMVCGGSLTVLIEDYEF